LAPASSKALLAAISEQIEQAGREGGGHWDSSTAAALGGRLKPTHDRAPNRQHFPIEVDIGPFQTDGLTTAHPRREEQLEERRESWFMRTRQLKQDLDFTAGPVLNSFVFNSGCTINPPHQLANVDCWIPRELRFALK